MAIEAADDVLGLRQVFVVAPDSPAHRFDEDAFTGPLHALQHQSSSGRIGRVLIHLCHPVENPSIVALTPVAHNVQDVPFHLGPVAGTGQDSPALPQIIATVSVSVPIGAEGYAADVLTAVFSSQPYCGFKHNTGLATGVGADYFLVHGQGLEVIDPHQGEVFVRVIIELGPDNPDFAASHHQCPVFIEFLDHFLEFGRLVVLFDFNDVRLGDVAVEHSQTNKGPHPDSPIGEPAPTFVALTRLMARACGAPTVP